MEKVVREVRKYVLSRWTLSELHGISHWDRVYENGQKLMTPEVNPLVVALFAYLHDSCREDDWADIEHGSRAAEWIDTIRESHLREVSDEEIEMLKKACRLHTTVQKTGNPTIDACFDADRLDLWRIGITPDPERLATEKGKEIARSTDYEPLVRPWIVDVEDEDNDTDASCYEKREGTGQKCFEDKRIRLLLIAIVVFSFICLAIMLLCNQFVVNNA